MKIVDMQPIMSVFFKCMDSTGNSRHIEIMEMTNIRNMNLTEDPV